MTIDKIKEIVLGRERDPRDPHIFHQISLIAFLAWIGLGADGLSSSCYGPEEAFYALGAHSHFALFLALATALTVFIISASYSQLIELFPTGGGGYLVATKLLGPYPGLVAGCALVVDYILTIAVSVSSGVDAIFSFLPPAWLPLKMIAIVGVIFFLIILNLRGVKESVILLTPIFLTFVVTHLILILYSIVPHVANFHGLVSNTIQETHNTLQTQGFLAVLFILMRGYSMGGGTYTGIEAVSNGIQILREPRVHTAKKTMLYMAVSLAFTAGGIMCAYLLMGVHHQPGMTLNAVLVSMVSQNWNWGGIPFGTIYFYITLISEGLLLFVAAQTGFIDGPRVLANMAKDSWVPRKFALLSDQLVIKNGILLMGFATLLIALWSRGSVRFLVVLYSINVFLTFTLTQLGMCVHWWQARDVNPAWKKKIAINGLGLLMTVSILIATVIIKFEEGGWVTLIITSFFIGVCLWIKSHYNEMNKLIKRLNASMFSMPLPLSVPSTPLRDTKAPTAVLMVSGFNGLGLHSLLDIIRTFPKQYKNIIFVSVGLIDNSKFKGVSEVSNLEQDTIDNLKKYVDYATRWGFYSEYRYSVGVDTIDEIEKMANEIGGEFDSVVFFSGKLMFKDENFLSRMLHNQASMAIQRRLLYSGYKMVVLPIRAY
jgi:amino acid transporter